MNILLAIVGAISQGVLWGLMTLGVYITFKILDFPDMTVDGSFALGGAVSAILVVKGVNPWLAILPAMCAGMIAGAVTGLLHTKVKIPGILAGILTMLALYSINVRIQGQANIPLLGERTVISTLGEVIQTSTNNLALIIGLIVSVGIVAVLYWFFGTELGSSIRATGNNEYMVRALGVNTDKMKIIGLMLSNALVALSGAFVSQSQGFADVGMGQGAIVIGLASIIIGEVIFGNRFNFAYKLASIIGGSIIYRIIIAVVLQLGMQSTDLKLLTAVIVAIALGIPVMKKKLDQQAKRRET
ncbi:ABC transporter permease [Cellulosilyticum lentocellum]|uniref:ABC-type transporter, integral membrane subunit n=1 Tax=Cellulosilyticum lentocellum (strain ATCC 49066 / DSM 5427 / NCIMB 11756 / RHM5) TaxID=642492 RepID=F2JM22_CELLD|nr:ABC transporter permease [Cellulosilyticum lentocellum]ADZ85802.1 ABC-type transporter, integral membrane subunit [Cellulosilyticum lentocellum DSM 5427]